MSDELQTLAKQPVAYSAASTVADIPAVLEQVSKPAVQSVTIWGTVIAALGAVNGLLPLLLGGSAGPITAALGGVVVLAQSPEAQALVSSGLAFFGALMAAWGRVRSQGLAISGVVKSK